MKNNFLRFVENSFSGRIPLLTIALLPVLSSGCGAIYETQRRDRLQECYSEYEGLPRQHCIEENEANYADYERQRKEILEQPED